MRPKVGANYLIPIELGKLPEKVLCISTGLDGKGRPNPDGSYSKIKYNGKVYLMTNAILKNKV